MKFKTAPAGNYSTYSFAAGKGYSVICYGEIRIEGDVVYGRFRRHTDDGSRLYVGVNHNTMKCQYFVENSEGVREQVA